MFHTRAGASLLLGTSAQEVQRQHEQSSSSCAVVGLSPLSARSFKLRYSTSRPPAGYAPFASISSNLIRTLGTAGPDDTKRSEPATGIAYPFQFCHTATSQPCPQLAGLGVRAKKILGLKNINVYTVGVYVDGSAAKKVLGPKFKGAASSTQVLAQDQALYDSLVAADSVDKTLRLVIAFGGVKRDTFLTALGEQLEPPLKKLGDEASLDAFKRQFDGVTFHKGTEITFTSTGNKLITKIDGREAGVLTSRALSTSLWSIYLGPNSVSPDTKATLGATLAASLTNTL